jgi:poly(hydroxyalkanoate) granule-associated protein
MVKKLQKLAAEASTAGLQGSQLAQTVKDSASQIWLAGLGAFAKAQGGGSKVFDALIAEGVSVQRKSQAVAEEKLGDMAGRMSAMAGEVGQRANSQWDKLESIFEQRTERAMLKLGVPSAKALATLSARVDALAEALSKLGASPDVATRKAAASKPAGEGLHAAPPEPITAKKRRPTKAAVPTAAAQAPAVKRRAARKPAAPAA